MRKFLIVLILTPLLTSCMAANIVANIADVAYSVKGKGYTVETSDAKFEYFDSEKEITIPPLRKYFKLMSTSNDFISFSASESNDTNDCFVGLKFYKSNIQKNVESLQKFIDWNNEELSEKINSIELNSNNGKSITLLFKIDKETKKPLLIYSGKNCDLFSTTKYYSINLDNTKKIISEIKNWDSSIK